MGLYDLVGKEITLNETVTEGIMGRAVKKVKWLVVEAYPCFVRIMRVAENGNEVYDTLNIGTLITMGIVSQEGKVKYYG